ncbi:MAG: glycosyltransferase family 4 protein [Thermodesulfobacteriota bacterium]
MRIGINALYLIPGRVGGTETYIRNLVKALDELDDRNEYFIFINRESRGIFEEIAPRMRVVCSPFNASRRPVRILWEQFILPLQIIRRRIDVLFSAGMTAPFFTTARSVLALHDLQHENYPDNFSRVQLFFLKTIIKFSAKRAAKILTLSNKAREDIIRYYHIAEERVSVVHLGTNSQSFYRRGEDEKEEIRKKYSLPKNFILYLASSLPHKNYERLLLAFKAVLAEYPELCLVLIGARDYGSPEITSKITKLGLESNVIMLGWLPYEDIPIIYSASSLLVFPSLHEGFGLPIIEAMACGLPVVCSDIEPLIEIAGDAAELVDPKSEEAIAEGIKNVLCKTGLRGRLIQKGLKRAQDFTWEKTAMKTLSLLYGEAPNGH